MQTRILAGLVLAFLFLSLGPALAQGPSSAKSRPLNEIPMYGNVEKTPELKRVDEKVFFVGNKSPSLCVFKVNPADVRAGLYCR